jgi:hypothetical protein
MRRLWVKGGESDSEGGRKERGNEHKETHGNVQTKGEKMCPMWWVGGVDVGRI